MSRVVFALARVEGMRLLRHPLTIAAVLLMAGPVLYGWLFGDGLPRFGLLHEPPRGLQLAMQLVLGGAALIAANFAVLRARRFGTEQQFAVLVLPERLRVAALLLALVPVALVGALLAVIYVGVLAFAPGAVGRLDPYEVATVPVLVLLMGGVGVLLGRLWRSVVVAPLLVVVSGAILLVFASVQAATDSFVPYAMTVDITDPMFLPPPQALLTWPSGLHLLYLTGLAALIGVAALAVRGGRSTRVLVAGAVSLVLTVAAVVVQTASTRDGLRTAAARQQPALQTCRVVERVTYCAFEEFVPWIDEWSAVTQGVLREMPPELTNRPLAVRQRAIAGTRGALGDPAGVPVAKWRADDAAAGTPGAVGIGTRWGDGTETGFAARLAYTLITGDPAALSTLCGGLGVVVTWIAGQATPLTRAGLERIDAMSFGGVSFPEGEIGAGILVPDAEISLATALLSRPTAEVGARVRENWTELTAEGTTLPRAAELLGLPAPKVVDDGWSCR
ncbi:ABC transporter [Virgisporangium aliadipatigenens]|uniref:ABC transporter n=1 Tax=Virgisporangium aliadipatigenens TaxID=741659 RepID=A0A8J4DRQ7_9ACTN|nr:hypothetical protein [Virgisporangium aliadipatigenens]GIJ46557.1 ABC transporter [Virgisporangium aliadipatigenens]